VNLAQAQEIVRARSLGLCEACRGHGIHTHHRQARGMGGVHRAGAAAVNRPAALVRLCLTCHQDVESSRTWAESRGLLVPRPTDPATVPVYLDTVNGRGWFLLDDDGMYRWVDGPDPSTGALPV
jgi:hypothetical protein